MYPTFSSLARMWGRWIPEVAVDILVKQRGCFLRSVVIHVGIQLTLFFFFKGKLLGNTPHPTPGLSRVWDGIWLSARLRMPRRLRQGRDAHF